MSVVSGSVVHTPDFSQTISSGVVGSYGIPAKLASIGRNYQNGTAAGMIDLIHAKPYTLAAAAQTLDLTALTDLIGAALNFARVRELIIQNLSNFPVTIGAAAATQWLGFLGTTASTLIVPPLGIINLSDPSSVGGAVGAVVTGTSKSLKMDPGANTVNLNLILAGCSATS